jgi:hypothetical protein
MESVVLVSGEGSTAWAVGFRVGFQNAKYIGQDAWLCLGGWLINPSRLLENFLVIS